MLKEIMNEIKAGRAETQNEVKSCKEAIEKMLQITARVEAQERKFNYLEKERKKKNIIIHGLEEGDNETFHQLRQKVEWLLNQTMKTNIEMYEIDNFYRIGRKEIGKNRPIVIKFVTYWRKTETLRNTKYLKGYKISVQQDYTKEELEERTKLVKLMKEEIKEGKHAFIKGNKLIIEEKRNNEDQVSNDERIDTEYLTGKNENQKRLISPDDSLTETEGNQKDLKKTKPNESQTTKNLVQATIDLSTTKHSTLSPARLGNTSKGKTIIHGRSENNPKENGRSTPPLPPDNQINTKLDTNGPTQQM